MTTNNPVNHKSQLDEISCDNCYHFSLIKTESSVGICRKDPPTTEDASQQSYAKSLVSYGYPIVGIHNWCNSCSPIAADESSILSAGSIFNVLTDQMQISVQVGDYAIVHEDCYNRDGTLKVPARDSDLVRILGSPVRGYYEIVSTIMRMQKFTDGTWKVIEINDDLDIHTVVPKTSLTLVPHRWCRGGVAELSYDILTKIEGDKPYRLWKSGTPVKILKNLVNGTYSAKMGWEREENHYVFTREKWDIVTIPDKALKIAREEFSRLVSYG